jgi:hypothetical protein
MNIKLEAKLIWKAKLSNGEYVSDKRIIVWNKLKERVVKDNLKIVSLCLMDGDRVFNLHGIEDNPKFRAFYNEMPIDFNFFRILGSDVNGKNNNFFAIIEAIYPKYKLQMWVDEKSKNCWCIIN